MDRPGTLFDFAQQYERTETPGLLSWPNTLSDQQILEVILRPAKAGLASKLLEAYPNLRELGRAHPQDLAELGLTPALRHRLLTVFELARRYTETEWPTGTLFRSSRDIYEHFRERLAFERHELFVAILLDNKHRKLRDVVVSMGSLTASIVHPRDVFVRVVRESAAAVVFVHNHPSGDPTPSHEDIEITRRLRDVGELIGVRVLDHIIVGAGRYVSFVDDGYW